LWSWRSGIINMKQNIAPKFVYRIRRSQREADRFYNEPATLAVDAFLGDNNGVITTYQGTELQPGYVVVRDMSGNLSVAYNQRVPLTPGLAIKVGYEPLQPVLFQVLSVRDYLLENPALGVPAHHESHEFPNNDTVFVSSFQFLPGMIYTGAGFIVTLYPFFFKRSDGSRGFLRAQTLDLASYVPASGAQAFTICTDDDGVPVVVAGSTAGGIGTLTIANFPKIVDPTLHEIWGVRLYAGMTDVMYTDCYDFRFGGISGGGGGGSSSNVPIVVLGTARWSAPAGEDTFDFPDVVYEIQSVQVNGVTQDPLSYSLENINQRLVLDTPLPYDAIITANYTIEAL
jgi:hypothetical protein